MARTSLQNLHKAIQEHAKTEDRERRARDRRRFALGEMMEAAGLYDAEDPLLRGMLAYCVDDLSKMRDKWTARGLKEMQPIEAAPTVPARATFSRSVSLSKQARTALAAEGLKEIRRLDVKLGYGVGEDLQLWSGAVTDYGRADSVVTELGGTLTRLGGTAPTALKEVAA
jgi:hypothetical protein